MGLPVYSESASNTKPYDTLSSDPTARARSAIRREEHPRRQTARRVRTLRSYHAAAQLERENRQTPAQYASQYIPTAADSDFVPPDLLGSWDDDAESRLRYEWFEPSPEIPRETASTTSLAHNDNRGAARSSEADRAYNPHARPPPVFFSGIWSPANRDGDPSSRPRSRRGPNSVDVLPPLRRMSRRNIADELPPRDTRRRHSTRMPPAPEVNGLGDRQRSWTPDSEADQWETFLNTITPDPSLPSASSSFASAAASAPNNAVAVSASHPSADPQNINRDRHLPRIPGSGNMHTNVNATTSQSRSISPMPPNYMATPESESTGAIEPDDNENCDIPPQLSLVSPSATSDSDSASNASSDRASGHSEGEDDGANSAGGVQSHPRMLSAPEPRFDFVCPPDLQALANFRILYSRFEAELLEMRGRPVGQNRERLRRHFDAVTRGIDRVAPAMRAMTQLLHTITDTMPGS